MRSFIATSLIMASTTYAADKTVATVDIYGTNKLSASQVKSQFKNEIHDIADCMQHGSLSNSNTATQFSKAVNKMTSAIKANGGYAYVGLSPIMYPHDPITHITIDIIEKGDKPRLSYFLPKPKQNISDSHQLIKNWLAYQKIGFNIVFQDKQFPAYHNCPAYHCLFGFDHPLLQKYKTTFNQAEKYKTELVSVLRHDKSDEKRAAAVYILAHIEDSNELVKLLIPSINDASSLVRNNAMRVLGMVLEHKKDIDIPVSKIVKALDFPSTTDRNKALYILSGLAEKTENIKYIKSQAGSYLIATLKLEQPNNHDISYAILKKISGKNYSDRDYKAWEVWLQADYA